MGNRINSPRTILRSKRALMRLRLPRRIVVGDGGATNGIGGQRADPNLVRHGLQRSYGAQSACGRRPQRFPNECVSSVNSQRTMRARASCGIEGAFVERYPEAVRSLPCHFDAAPQHKTDPAEAPLLDGCGCEFQMQLHLLACLCNPILAILPRTSRRLSLARSS